MALLKLDVPVIAQTSSDTCWHASALMVWYYSQNQTGRQGPMNTLADSWVKNKPITDWPGLARVVGLKDVSTVKKQYTSDDLFNLLTAHGPLWSAGNWFGVGHIIVLTGVDGETIYFNDPDGGKKKTALVSWFNTKLFNPWPDCLQCKDPDRY